MTSATGVACSRCGTVNEQGKAFCVNCGNRLATTAAVSTQRPDTFESLLQYLKSPDFWREVQVRAKRQLLAVIVIGFIAFLDFQLHAQAPIALIILVGGLAGTLFFSELLQWAASKTSAGQNLPAWAIPVFATVPAALLFFLRGKGVLSATDGFIIALVIAGLPLLLNYLAPQVDPALRQFYETRNRVIPGAIRPLAMVGLSLFVTFALIHGNLLDIKILFGATASKAGSPSFGGAMLTVLVNVLIGYLMLHEPARPEAT